jgi:hypothetical protein
MKGERGKATAQSKIFKLEVFLFSFAFFGFPLIFSSQQLH